MSELDELPLALTVAEAAALLRVSPSTVYELIHRWRETGGADGIPGYRLGRCLRVPRAAIFRLLGLHAGGVGSGDDGGTA